jgi:putative flippase GtrA
MTTPEIVPKLYHRLFAHDFVRFVVIGGVGFVVNYVVLAVLYDGLGISITVSQIIGAEIALLSTFTGNNFWAFRHHHHIPVRKKLITYHGTAGTGILITSSLVIVLVKYAGFYYGLALAISACIGMVWNYTFNKLVVFRRQKLLSESRRSK